jgi:hypothetical protein
MALKSVSNLLTAVVDFHRDDELPPMGRIAMGALYASAGLFLGIIGEPLLSYLFVADPATVAELPVWFLVLSYGVLAIIYVAAGYFVLRALRCFWTVIDRT